MITALLTGPVLGTRIFGGRPPPRAGTACRGGTWPTSVPPCASASAGDDLDATWLERWMRDHVIGRIPGGTHDPEGSG